MGEGGEMVVRIAAWSERLENSCSTSVRQVVVQSWQAGDSHNRSTTVLACFGLAG